MAGIIWKMIKDKVWKPWILYQLVSLKPWILPMLSWFCCFCFFLELIIFSWVDIFFLIQVMKWRGSAGKMIKDKVLKFSFCIRHVIWCLHVLILSFYVHLFIGSAKYVFQLIFHMCYPFLCYDLVFLLLVDCTLRFLRMSYLRHFHLRLLATW